jgi:hypothetical protein
MRRAEILAGLVLLIALPHAEAAEEWRYCLAPAQAAHKVYISGLFQTNGAMDTVEAAFGRALSQLGVEHDGVQCPRAASQAALSAMQQYAIGFNHERGNRAVKLDWKPPR